MSTLEEAREETGVRWATLIPPSLLEDDGTTAHVLIPVDVLADLLHLSVSQSLAHGSRHLAERAVARCFVQLSNSGYVARPGDGAA